MIFFIVIPRSAIWNYYGFGLYCLRLFDFKDGCLMGQQDSSASKGACQARLVTWVQFLEPLKRWIERNGSTKLSSDFHTYSECGMNACIYNTYAHTHQK